VIVWPPDLFRGLDEAAVGVGPIKPTYAKQLCLLAARTLQSWVGDPGDDARRHDRPLIPLASSQCLLGEGHRLDATIVSQQPIVTDLGEALRQHMKKSPATEGEADGGGGVLALFDEME